MLFNSIEFGVFLPVVFLLYWFVFNKNLRVQNLLLVASSFFFYGWWDWRFLFLLVLSSGVDFVTAVSISNTQSRRKKQALLIISLAMNLGVLGFFKYFNFFAESFADAFHLFGRPFEPFSLSIILPIGVSFYTFQALSYTIDVYREKLQPTADPVAYFAFISFFPQLVAGPIERATNLLPQFYSKREFDYTKAVDGLRQMLWGMFKKIVVADNCAHYVNMIFNGYENYNGSTLLLGALLFSFQIYCDFSGYSDIAIGVARLFGFSLMQNFAYPYFSRDIAEFWRKWHISLSSWFRDYVYIPLGGSRGSMWLKVRNTFVIFLLSGFWHGANWTFVVWGGIHAVYFLPLMLSGRNRFHMDAMQPTQVLPSIVTFLRMLVTFMLVSFAWIFFRSESLTQAVAILSNIFSTTTFRLPSFTPGLLLSSISLLLLVEWLQRGKKHALQFSGSSLWLPLRWSFYISLIVYISWFGGTQQEFIYFDF